MVQLEIIPSNFPSIGGASEETDTEASVFAAEQCSCIPRSQTPGRPSQLPMKVCVDNIPKMDQWLRERYKSSTMNVVCPHTPISDVRGPYLQMLVDHDRSVKPVNAFTPAKVPLHWEDEVLADIQKDEDMGVIEKVPYGEPTTWCHRMVVTGKGNGKPRRTVDLSTLNNFFSREVHPMKAPFELAKGIYPNAWSTVTDAWNGFHSIPLHPEDRHPTTFITQQGLYRYLKALQGYASSGDGFNRRLDEITVNFERLKRCVDDNCFYDRDEDLELHWN